MKSLARWGIDSFTLKLLMAALMMLDHLYYNLFPQTLLWAHYAARVVAPVFVYLVTEGMLHTRNRKRYILRIIAFGAGMMLGSCILRVIFGSMPSNSILMTLGLSAAVIACIDNARKRDKSMGWWVLATIGLLAASAIFEGGLMIPGMAIIFYYLRERPVVMWATYFVYFGGMFLLQAMQTQHLQSQFYMVFAIFPILLYNGKRGIGGGFARYFFYVFYPLHIWIIFLIEQIVVS